MTPADRNSPSAIIEQIRSGPPGRLYCVQGDSSVFRLSLYAAAHVLVSGVPVTLVDGSNRFDVYYLAEFARRYAGDGRRQLTPQQILRQIFVSRAFTCYQMEALITERLPAFVRSKQSPVVVIFGLLDTFYDEQAPLFEVQAGVQRMLGALRGLTRDRVSVLLASADIGPVPRGREGLWKRVAQEADGVLGPVHRGAPQSAAGRPARSIPAIAHH